MAPYRLLNVFTAEDGSHGNPLAVFLDGSGYSDDEKQAIATDLNYSETVFVEDVDSGRIRMFGFLNVAAGFREDIGVPCEPGEAASASAV